MTYTTYHKVQVKDSNVFYREEFTYRFDHLAKVVDKFTEAVGQAI